MKFSFSTLLNVVLGIVLLTSLFFAGVTVSVGNYSTTSTGSYDPWCDLDDDGDVDIFDIVKIAGIYGTSGQPFAAKAALEYDSGWVDITDKAGQYFNVTHNLNSTDIMVDIQGKTTLNSGVHQRYLGGEDYLDRWSRTYGGTGDDDAVGTSSVVQTSDGGYAIAGRTTSFGAGSYDFWLVKTDSAGNMQWSRTYGGTDDDMAYSLVQTSDGGFALVGQTLSFGAGLTDCWLVKTDGAGNMQWNQTYGGEYWNNGASMIQASDGGYAIAGASWDWAAGQSDFWLVKTDSAGNHLWNKTYGGGTYEDASSIVGTSDGGYAIAGRTYTNVQDFMMVKTNASGDMEWSRTYGGSNFENARSVIQTGDGGYALVGVTDSFGAGNIDAWLVKTDASGNLLWNKTYGGTDADFTNAVVQTADGGYAIAGATGSFGAGGYDFWLVKTDSAGNQLWGQTYGSTESESGKSMIQAADGGYVVAGWTGGEVESDCGLVKTDSSGNAQPGFRFGLAWTDSTANTLTLYRGVNDFQWNYVRVRIWEIKENP